MGLLRPHADIVILDFETALTTFPLAPTVKPDPPSQVKVQQVEAHKTQLKVTWSFPISWKSRDSYYQLKYELKYKPLESSIYYEQVGSGRPTDQCHTYTADVFTDAVLGLPAGNKYSLVSADDSMCSPGCLSLCVSLDNGELHPDLTNH